jgi:DNA invertase Pin-like site-specific DNA recombinase
MTDTRARRREPDIGSDPVPGGTTAVIYVRVSTKEQAERDGDPEGYSIPAQREACTRKAASLGAVMLDEFVDRGESARTADRPELHRLLDFVQANQVTYAIVHKIDRLARNRADDVAINLALKQAGVQLVSVTENIDETPSGILLHGIMSSIAEFYSRNLANEVIKGSVQKAKAGGTPARAPTGYLNVRRILNGQEVRTVEIDPERGPLMAWAFEAYASGGWSIRTLLAELTARGLTSTPGPKTPAKALGMSNLQRLLRHPYYMGIVRYRDVLYPGKHEPLVSPETWQKVQELLAANNFAGDKQREHRHYLKGSVYCGACHSRLVVSHAKNRHGTIYPYFICIGRHQKRTPCTQQAIRIEQTEDAVAAVYATIRLTDDQANQVRDFVLDEILKLRADASCERERQGRRLRVLQDERKKLLDAHYANAIPLDLLKTEQARITAEITTSAARLAAVDNDFNSAETNLTKALTLIQDCEAAYRSAPDKLRRQFNQAFFKRLLIDDNYNVTGELAEPFETLLSEELRQAAARKAEADLTTAVDEAFRERDRQETPRSELALAGVTATPATQATMLAAQGLKEKMMVGVEGLEPPTSAL